MTQKTKRHIMVAAAVAGLVAGTTAGKSSVFADGTKGKAKTEKSGCASKADPNGCNQKQEEASKNVCKGHNSCKGKGGCKTGDNGCKGKNSCKGKGGCKT